MSSRFSNRQAGKRRRGSSERASAAAPARPVLADWLGGDRMFSPLGFEPAYDYPLLVWLPDPEAGRGFELGRVMKRVSLRNFVAVEPHVDGDPSDHDALEAAVWRSIDRVCDRIAIHPGRIYLVGDGAGGSAAFRIGCRHPQSFGGAISLGGPFPLDEGLFARLSHIRRLPMLMCCHATDSAAAARHTDRTLRLFHAAGAALAMRIYPGHDPLSKTILGDVNRWLMDEISGASLPMRPACTGSG